MSLINQCPNHPQCNGRLRIVSLDRDERIRRRIGAAMVGRCVRCGAESIVVKDAWLKFAKELRLVRDRDRDQLRLF